MLALMTPNAGMFDGFDISNMNMSAGVDISLL
jgi:hypothetical protein